jgi:hypothetical protein
MEEGPIFLYFRYSFELIYSSIWPCALLRAVRKYLTNLGVATSPFDRATLPDLYGLARLVMETLRDLYGEK